MQDIGREFAETVERRLKELNKKPFTVEREHDLPKDSIRNVLRAADPAGPRLTNLKRICDALGLDVRIEPKRGFLGFADAESPTSYAPEKKASSDIVALPWHDRTRLSGSSPIGMSLSWLSAKNVAPDNLRAVMIDVVRIPGPLEGEVLAVVDVAAARKGPPAPWVAIVDGKATAVETEFLPRATILHQVMPDRSSALFLDDDRVRISVLGRIRWIGGPGCWT